MFHPFPKIMSALPAAGLSLSPGCSLSVDMLRKILGLSGFLLIACHGLKMKPKNFPAGG